MKFGLIGILSLSLFASIARAEFVKVLDVEADYYPEHHYSLGFDLDSSHLISRLYFKTDNDTPDYFTLAQLKHEVTLFTIVGIPVVKMRIVNQESPDSAVIALETFPDAFHSLKTTLFHARYNASIGRYDIEDTRSHQVIHKAKVTTRYRFGIPIGIYDVVTE